MTRRVAFAAVLVGLFGYAFGAELLHAATCTGSNPCNACKNCKCARTARRGAALAECAARGSQEQRNGVLRTAGDGW